MKVHRTIRYRLHPQTRAKHGKLFSLAGACRCVWNERIEKLCGHYKCYGFAVEQDEAAVAHEIKAIGIDRNAGQVATSEGAIYRL